MQRPCRCAGGRKGHAGVLAAWKGHAGVLAAWIDHAGVLAAWIGHAGALGCEVAAHPDPLFKGPWAVGLSRPGGVGPNAQG